MEEVKLSDNLFEGAHVGDQFKWLECGLQPVEVAWVDSEKNGAKFGVCFLEEGFHVDVAPPFLEAELIEVIKDSFGLIGSPSGLSKIFVQC